MNSCSERKQSAVDTHLAASERRRYLRLRDCLDRTLHRRSRALTAVDDAPSAGAVPAAGAQAGSITVVVVASVLLLAAVASLANALMCFWKPRRGKKPRAASQVRAAASAARPHLHHVAHLTNHLRTAVVRRSVRCSARTCSAGLLNSRLVQPLNDPSHSQIQSLARASSSRGSRRLDLTSTYHMSILML